METPRSPVPKSWIVTPMIDVYSEEYLLQSGGAGVRRESYEWF